MTDKIRVVSESGDDYPVNLSHETYQECTHEFVSWHGDRAECQECGEYVNALIENQAVLNNWADGVYRKDQGDD